MTGTRTRTLAAMSAALSLLVVANAAAGPQTTPEKVRVLAAWIAAGCAVILLKAAIVAGAMTANALFADVVERAEARVATQPIRTSSIGLGGLVLGLWMTFMLLRVSLSSWLGLALLCAMIAVTLCGLAAVYACVGRRLGGSQETGGSVLRGGAALETAALIPVFGWLGQFVMLCMGLGAALLSLRDRSRSDASESWPPPEEAEE